jgi:hypothetical protein
MSGARWQILQLSSKVLENCFGVFGVAQPANPLSIHKCIVKARMMAFQQQALRQTAAFTPKSAKPSARRASVQVQAAGAMALPKGLSKVRRCSG